MQINSADLTRAVGDETWRAIDRSMQAGATADDVLAAVMSVRVAIATERRFGVWCTKIRDIHLGYLDCLEHRLHEVDDGSEFTQVAAGAIVLAKAAGDAA